MLYINLCSSSELAMILKMLKNFARWSHHPKNSWNIFKTDFERCFLFSPLFSRVLLSSAQCVMARVKKINVVIYDDLAPWKLFSDKFSPYPNSSMRRSLVIFLLGTDHRHYHQYTDNGSLHRVWNNVLTFILKEHLLFSFLTASHPMVQGIAI